MKKVFATVSVVFALAGVASASFIEVDRKGDDMQAQICIEKNINKSIGVFAYSCIGETWKEAYVGPELNGSVGKLNYQIAYGAGLETGSKFRHGGWVWAGFGKLSGIYLSENGGSGPWTKFVVQYKVAPKLGLGYTEKSFAGKGLYIQYKPTSNLTVKISGFNKFKSPEIGLNLAF